MPALTPNQATLAAVRRARHREALVRLVEAPAPATKPFPLPVPPPVERPLLAWPWRVLGGVFIVLWALTCAAMALAVAVFVGFALVMGVVALAVWIPVPVTAAVIGVVLFLGMWAVIVR